MGGGSSKEMASPFLAMPQARHKATLIFLHGLGDTGQGWCDAFRQLNLQHIKCVCPTAPVQPVTLNGGFRMPSWFDIMALSPEGPEDETGIEKACKILRDMITEEEKSGITLDNVFVGGFSQGGAVALYTAMTLDKRLAGYVGLSTWMPLHKRFPQAFNEINRDIPMFQAHGTMDPLVPPQWGQLTSVLVQTMTKNHIFKTYPIMHTSCQDEMDAVKQFLTSIVKND